MDYNSMIQNNKVEFGQMPPGTFLIGLLSAYENKFQTVADSFFEEITWKQFFAIISINLCSGNPTINDLADVMGTSHQNEKQILLKLENVGFLEIIRDEENKSKQRIVLTKKCMEFFASHEEGSNQTIAKIFEGIAESDILVTIQTILSKENNLRNIT